MTKKSLFHLIPLGITAILGALFNWLFLPAWTVRSGGFWGFIFAMAIIAFAVDALISYIISDYDEHDTAEKIALAIYGGIAAVITVVIIISGIAGAKMFNASKYQQLISVEEGKNISDVIPDVTETEIPVVDMSNAQKLGDRTIGGIKNATWYDVDDEYNVIVYQGKQYRISPLNYSGGVFRYNKAKYFGLPGYVLVDTTTQEAEYVELEKPMKFSPSAMFGEDLTRMLRNKYPTAKFNSAFFEIDEEGNPFWVVSIESPKISLYKGNVITGVILVDPCTGECT